jgi:hypothetical protein
MSLESSSQYQESLGTDNSPNSVVVQTNSLHSMSLIIQSIGGSLETYYVDVSNDCKTWIRLREISCGGNNVNQNFNQVNTSVFASILDWHYVRFSVDALGEGVKSNIYVSCR